MLHSVIWGIKGKGWMSKKSVVSESPAIYLVKPLLPFNFDTDKTLSPPIPWQSPLAKTFWLIFHQNLHPFLSLSGVWNEWKALYKIGIIYLSASE